MKKGWWGTYQRELQRKSVGPKAQCKGRNKRKCSFRRPDTKCFCCYLVSLLAWGTSSGSTVPEDIRKQFLLCRTMFYFTSTADLIINYIRVVFFHFRTQRNIPIIRGGPGPWSGRRPGVSGVSNPKRTIVQQQQCFLRMCKVMFAPK